MYSVPKVLCVVGVPSTDHPDGGFE